MTAPIDVSEAISDTAEPKVIEGRSLWSIAWLRLKRDKAAMAGGIIVVLLVIIALPGVNDLVIKTFGHPVNDFHEDILDPVFGTPHGAFGGISSSFLFGVEPKFGRDLFSRIVGGLQVSLLIGFVATLVSVAIGTFLGILAGYFGGWVDSVIARLMDVFLAFPLLLFAIALAGVLPDSMLGLSGNGLRMAVLIFIIGFFNWPYIGRIIRGQTIAIREREFVDAARSLGASNSYVLFREILPNLIAPIIVYSSLLIPTNILFESALSFLGVGINPPKPSWGAMLSDATDYYATAPYFVVVPGLAIFITVMAFNLFGDGLRDALDPRSK
ncbi:MAG TPA: ABC transporter permease [Streptosporangiaceae bacterium]|nr:ABC transporter permease [Streptosporangiaceae bacterium]